MGDLTRAQFRAEVAANLGGRDDLESGSPLDTVNRALDRILTRIVRANSNGWSELKRYDTEAITVTGVKATDVLYTNLPTNLDKIKSLLVKETGVTYSYRLVQMLRSQWDFLIGDSESRPVGQISHYVDERGSTVARQLRWWPVPQLDFTLFRMYTVKPTPFALDTSVSDFEDKDDLILSGTTAYMLNRYQAFEESDAWFKAFSSQLQEAVKEDKRNPDVHAIPRSIQTRVAMAGIDPWLNPFAKSNRGS